MRLYLNVSPYGDHVFQIRRRQRKGFLAANSKRGLYFTPRLYDAFVALLQRAKSIALAAEAGEYKDATTTQDLDSETFGGRGGAELRQATGGDSTRILDGGANAKLGDQQFERTNERKIKDDGDNYDKHSTSSTRPTAAVSMAAEAADANEDDESTDRNTSGQDEEDDGNDMGKASRWRAAKTDETTALAAGATGAAGSSTGGAARLDGANRNVSIGTAKYQSGQAAPLMDQTMSSQQAETPAQDNLTIENAAATSLPSPVGRLDTAVDDSMEALRGMLKSLDCGEWNGGVDAVLEAIDGLSRWIPLPVDSGNSATAAAAAEQARTDVDQGVDLTKNGGCVSTAHCRARWVEQIIGIRIGANQQEAENGDDGSIGDDEEQNNRVTIILLGYLYQNLR